jgi:hypothetical protein
LIGASVVFDKIPLLNDVALEPEIVPAIPETVGADQVYVVLAGTIVEAVGCPLEGVNEYDPPVQITWL